jgi:ADP-ribose pyrophosphatase YjhB (NUDIX family)
MNEQREVLVADEYIRGGMYTKFPGGGLEFGEGTRDCLKREFMEEMNLKIEVLEHIYTTDFFQMSAFNPSHQIISIYYRVKALEPITAPIRSTPFDFDAEQIARYQETGEIETFRLIPIDQLSQEDVTLPIDKVVVRTIKEMYS